jgi:nitroreductase
MDLLTAIETRGSTRAFLSDPVPADLIRQVLTSARFAPSGTNIQPWQVHVVSGQVRAAIVREVTHAATFEREQHAAEYAYYPETWREPYLARRRACGWGLYSLLGITKGDRERGHAQELRNFCFFDAPVGLFFFIDQDLGRGSWLDYGMFMQNIMLAALAHGLTTCPQAAWLPYHKIIKAHLGVAGDKTLVCGMAMGKPDPTQPVNGYRPSRLEIDEFTHWHLGAH